MYVPFMVNEGTVSDNRLASADRRPVDPPPVVELRIYEGDARNDVTFSHNANFFLYTTLESTRQIAPGRLPQVPAPLPVLTGMPVAGMAYLDRPSPAGYFIFPDLSVRHEGKYRLAFNLFEELKEPQDADAETSITSPDHPRNVMLRSSPMAPQAHVHFRLEVKSDPFTVFSAKKFPGLSESTALSRVVADQGCRVRIRRDVRMRRREGKHGKGYDDYDEEGSYSRQDQFATPDPYSQAPMSERPGSVSNGNMNGNIDVSTPYGLGHHRSSTQDLNYYQSTAHQAPTAPLAEAPRHNFTSHMNFGSTSVPHFHVPAYPASAPPVPQHPQTFSQSTSSTPYSSTGQARHMSNPNIYGHHSSQSLQYPQNYQLQTQAQYPSSSPAQSQASYQTNGHSQSQVQYPPLYHSQPQPQLPPQRTYSQGSNFRQVPEQRRDSAPQSHQSYTNPAISSYIEVDPRHQSVQQSKYPQPPQNYIPRSSTPNGPSQVLPPLTTMQPPQLSHHLPTPASSNSYMAPTPTYDGIQSRFAAYAMTPSSAHPNSGRTGKRGFDSAFDATHIERPMHGGERPSLAQHGQDIVQIEADDGTMVDDHTRMLTYKRAGGQLVVRKPHSPTSD